MHINLKMKNWHLDSTVEWILALIHTNELKVRNEEHLHGISSGCPAGPRRRRCPLRLVPFWTPPVRQTAVTFSTAAIDCDRLRTTEQTGSRINVWRRGNGIKANEMLKKTEITTVWFYHASTAIGSFILTDNFTESSFTLILTQFCELPAGNQHVESVNSH